MATLPLRFKILYLLHKAGCKALTTKELYDGLVNDYKGEGQFSLDKMENHLMAIKAVALIDGVEPYIDEEGAARYKYRITSAGEARIRFLPSEWQK